MRWKHPRRRPPDGAPLRAARLPRRDRARAHLARLGQDGLERPRGRARPIENALPAGRLPGLADLHGRLDDADVRSGDLAARRSKGWSTGRRRSRTPSCAACRAPSRSPTSTASRAGRSATCTGPASASRTCSPLPARRRRGRCSSSSPRRSPYVDTLTLQQAELHDAMLAYEMNGKPLSREHGAPVRVVIPEMYGYKNVKWVAKIVVTDHVDPGLLGAARLRRRCMRRQVEWPLSPVTREPALFTNAPRLHPPLLANGADAALGARGRVLRAARLRARALPPAA